MRNVHCFVFVFLLSFIGNVGYAQTWLPEFRIRIGYNSILPKTTTLNEFLTYDHPIVAENCQARMSVFYFKVNSKGMVDSLYSEGNFKEKEKDIILKNIKGTSGNWILPKTTRTEDYCWFVFPCFILGALDKYCPDDQQNFRQLVLLRGLLQNYSFSRDKHGRYLLPPNEYGFYSRR